MGHSVLVWTPVFRTRNKEVKMRLLQDVLPNCPTLCWFKRKFLKYCKNSILLHYKLPKLKNIKPRNGGLYLTYNNNTAGRVERRVGYSFYDKEKVNKFLSIIFGEYLPIQTGPVHCILCNVERMY